VGGLRPGTRPGTAMPDGPAIPPGDLVPRLRRRPADLQLARADGFVSVAAVLAAAGPGGGRVHRDRTAGAVVGPAGAGTAGDRGAAGARRAGSLELRRALLLHRQQLRGGDLEAVARRHSAPGRDAAVGHHPERPPAPAAARRRAAGRRARRPRTGGAAGLLL